MNRRDFSVHNQHIAHKFCAAILQPLTVCGLPILWTLTLNIHSHILSDTHTHAHMYASNNHISDYDVKFNASCVPVRVWKQYKLNVSASKCSIPDEWSTGDSWLAMAYILQKLLYSKQHVDNWIYVTGPTKINHLSTKNCQSFLSLLLIYLYYCNKLFSTIRTSEFHGLSSAAYGNGILHSE